MLRNYSVLYIRKLQPGELPGTKTYYDYDTLRSDIVEEFKNQNMERLMDPVIRMATIDLILSPSICTTVTEMIKNYGAMVPDLIGLTRTNSAS